LGSQPASRTKKNLATRKGTLMKSWCSLTLASLPGCALGAAALQAVHAQAKPLIWRQMATSEIGAKPTFSGDRLISRNTWRLHRATPWVWLHCESCQHYNQSLRRRTQRRAEALHMDC